MMGSFRPEHSLDVLATFNEKSWSREREYGRSIGNIEEAEHLYSDPDQRNSTGPFLIFMKRALYFKLINYFLDLAEKWDGL